MNIRLKRGYSLLEILMILAVIGMSALILFPVAADLIKKWNSEATVNELRVRLREVQQEAIKTQRVHGIRLSFINQNYELQEDTTNSGVPDTTYEVINIKSGVNLTGSDFGVYGHRVYFDMFGAPQAAGAISFGNANGDPVEVMIELVTGKTTINWN